MDEGSVAALPAEGGDEGQGAPALLAEWLGREAAPANDAAVEGATVEGAAVDAAAVQSAAVDTSTAALLVRATEVHATRAPGPGEEAARAPAGETAPEPADAGPAAEARDTGVGGGQARGRQASPRRPAEAARKAAADRLRLARVVLDAGFAADAARAAYEALAETIAGMLEGPAPESHAALIAGVYRDLVPAGGLPVETHAVLARLHDLGTLARAGVPLDAALARSAVDEATTWIGRLGGAAAERAAEP
ncbi:hypothetical protein [Sorangium sp. So ce341]|uniref:hypothetical protein n=1 Tax=Sorangium sp. So ce341 TaxID=3133302 RepID=UPI003F601CB7